MSGLCVDPVVGVCKGTFLGKLVASLYAVLTWTCVLYRRHCVSLEEKTHLGRHLVVTPTNSRIEDSYMSWTVGEIVKGGAIPATVSPQGILWSTVFIH